MNKEHDVEIYSNLIGLAFLVGSDQFINSCFGQILQIPHYNPIFKREHANNMYSVHAYYLSMVSQILSFGWMYPAIITLCTFYFYGLEYDSAADLFTYMVILFLLYLGGVFFGLFCGTLTDNE